MAQTPAKAKTPAWVAGMRASFKLALAGNVPTGLTAREQTSNGKAVIRYSPPDGRPEAITIPGVLWQQSDAEAIKNAFVRAAAVVRSGASLKSAFSEESSPVAATVIPGAVDWSGIVDAFLSYKLESGQIQQGTLRDYRPSMEAVRTLAPSSDGTVALLREATAHMTPGSRGRKQRMQHISALLLWAREEGHLGDAWKAATTRQKQEITGKKLEAHAAVDPCTLTDEEIVGVIEAIPDERWKLAVQLMASFGLRPVELLHLSADELPGWVFCSYRKRTSRGQTKPRSIPPLVPAGADWTAEEIVEQWMAEANHPPLESSTRKVSGNVAQYLERREAWQKLRDRNANDPRRSDLVPYAFRHSFAQRAHLQGKPTAAAAQAMGHSHETHLRHSMSILGADQFAAAWGS